MDKKELIKLKKEVEKWLEDPEFKNDLWTTTDVLKKVKKMKVKNQSIQKQIADELGMNEWAISRKVGKLKKHGLVRKVQQQWYIDMVGKQITDAKAKLWELTEKGKRVLNYLKIKPLTNNKSNNGEKIGKRNNDQIPISAREFHSEKIRELVVERLLNEFPIVEEDGLYDPIVEKDGISDFIIEKDGIYAPLEGYKHCPYTGKLLSIEVDEVLFEDFLKNHLEFATAKDFNTWLAEFKEIARKWWEAYDTVIKGVKLDLKNHLEIPYSHQGDKLNGFTDNLINWVMEGMKCYMDHSCLNHYYRKYYVDGVNGKVEPTKRGDILSLDYNIDREILIIREKGNLQPEEFKAKMDKKIREYMEKKLSKAPFFKLYQKNRNILSKAKELREKIITFLKRNQQIPIYKVRKCPYLTIDPLS